MTALFFAVFFMVAGRNMPVEPVPTSMVEYKDPTSMNDCKARVEAVLKDLKKKDGSKHYLGGCINTEEMAER